VAFSAQQICFQIGDAIFSTPAWPILIVDLKHAHAISHPNTTSLWEQGLSALEEAGRKIRRNG
jgi:Trm5-related predicted tRNA methylase